MISRTHLDVIDVLTMQHDEIRELCAGVQRAAGGEKKRRFTALAHQVHLHELGERAVVHPAARDCTAAGNPIGLARMREEDAIGQSFADLKYLGTTDAQFDDGFARLHRAILDHASREELDEFPLMRLFVPPQRLHMMAGQLTDVQLMASA